MEMNKMEMNKTYNLDCMEGLKLLESESVDLIVTYPPFGVGLQTKMNNLHNGKKTYAERDKSYVEWDYDYDYLLKEFYRVLKNKSHCYIICADHQLRYWLNAIEKSDFKFRQLLVLLKRIPVISMAPEYRYMFQQEFVLYCDKGSRKLNKKRWRKSVIYFDNSDSKKLHPCQKTINIWKTFIEASSDEVNLILDPFMGIGGVAEGCKCFKRNYIGFEISEKYCNMANNRAELTTKKLDEY